MAVTRETARMMAIAGAVGVASGVASYLLPTAIEALGINNDFSFVKWLLRLWPGIIFGGAIALYLALLGVAAPLRAAIFVPLDAGAWYAALWFSIGGAKGLGFPFTELWQLGIASGLIGASLVALSALALFPLFRRWKFVAAMIVAGGAAGVLLGNGAEGLALAVLFVVWQGAVAACFGWGVAIAARNTGSPAPRPG